MTQEDIYVRPVETLGEFQACQQIHRQVWGFSAEDTVVHLPLMVALQKNGGLVLGAFCAKAGSTEELVGFGLSFIGCKEQTQQYFHYSQLVAALPQWQSRGVGYFVKTAQRREVLKRGYTLIRWAFDPLESRNAYFNIAKLGGISSQYLPNWYGAGRGELFGQLETDRLIIDWELKSERVKERLAAADANNKPDLPLEEYESLPPLVQIEWLTENVPKIVAIDFNRHEPVLKLEIPYNNKQVQKTSLDAAREWRSQTRALFTHYFQQGYTVADFFTSNDENASRAFYVLKR